LDLPPDGRAISGEGDADAFVGRPQGRSLRIQNWVADIGLGKSARERIGGRTNGPCRSACRNADGSRSAD
jgi:hypothetical protein